MDHLNKAIRATGGGFITKYNPMGMGRKKDERIVETPEDSGTYHVVVDGNQLTTETVSFDEACQIVDNI